MQITSRLTSTCDPPAPEPNPLGDDEGDSAPGAVTLQSLLIDQTMRRCLNCGADHRTWACSEIRQALFAPEPTDADLGRALCRMRWRDHRAFVALLLDTPVELLRSYAAGYVDFIKEYDDRSDLTVNQVLRAWGRAMSSPERIAA